MRRSQVIVAAAVAVVVLCAGAWLALELATRAEGGDEALAYSPPQASETGAARAVESAPLAAPPAQAGQRAPPAAPAIRGRMVDVTTGLGVAGRRVELWVTRPRVMQIELETLGRVLVDAPAVQIPATRELFQERIRSFLTHQQELRRGLEMKVDVQLVPPPAPPPVEAPEAVPAVEEPAPEPRALLYPGGARLEPLPSGEGKPIVPVRLRIESALQGIAEPPVSLYAPVVTLQAAGGRSAERIAETVTGDDGAFELACPAGLEEGTRLELFAPLEGASFVEPSTVRLPRGARACEEPVDWRVEVLSGDVLRGVVLDEVTREPVSEVEVRIAGDGRRAATALTGADGSFATEEPVPFGRLDLQIRELRADRAIPCAPTEIDFEAPLAPGEALLLLASLGPTYRFADLELHPGKRLRPPGPALSTQEVRARVRGLVPLADAAWEENPFTEWRRVETGAESWVRYAERARAPRGGEVWVELRTTDDQWIARARFEHVSGRGGEPARVELAQACHLRGRALPDQVERYRRSIAAAVYSDASGPDELDRTEIDDRGAFCLRGLDPERLVGLQLDLRDGTRHHVAIEKIEPGQELEVVLPP